MLWLTISFVCVYLLGSAGVLGLMCAIAPPRLSEWPYVALVIVAWPLLVIAGIALVIYGSLQD